MGNIGFKVWGLEGMEKKMEIAIMGYIRTIVRIHSFIHSYSYSCSFEQHPHIHMQLIPKKNCMTLQH